MKGCFLAAAALCCIATANVLFTSCDRNVLLTSGSAIVNVNTATLYDKLEITDLMAERLAKSENMKITDSVLVYDQQGMLVAKHGVETRELQTIHFGLGDLPRGVYKVLAWQTVTSGSDPYWYLMDADRLSSAHIEHWINMAALGFHWAIGLYATTLTVGEETALIDAEMEPMGSVVDFRLDGFTPESNYSRITLYSHRKEPAPIGFYLDPARSGEERWVAHPEGKMEWDRPVGELLPDGSGLSLKRFTLYHGEKKRFIINGTDKTTKEKEYLVDATYDLKPGHVVFYLDLEKISYQPPYFGPTAGFAEWKAKRDEGFLVSDPCLQWGTDYQTARKRVENLPWWKPINDDLEQDAHGWLRYYRIAQQLYEMYYFTEEDGRNLFRVICFITDDTVPVGVPLQHVTKQGFELKGAIQFPDHQKPTLLLLSPDEKTEVLLIPDGYGGSCWEIIYKPTDPDEVSQTIPIMG